MIETDIYSGEGIMQLSESPSILKLHYTGLYCF